MRIDTHAHQLPAHFRDEVRRRTGADFPLPELTTDQHLAAMDEHRIELAVVSLPPPGIHVGTQDDAGRLARLINEHYAELVSTHPGRFAALASLPLPDVDSALAELEHALDVLDLDGVALSSNVGGVYVGDDRFAPLLAELDRRGAYVFLHPADPQSAPLEDYPRWLLELPFETTRAVVTLLYGGALDRYPGITWHVPHCGGTVPFLAHRLATLVQREPRLATRVTGDPVSRLAGLYYDTAQAHNEPALAATLAVVGADRLVFGTDWPFAVLAPGGDPQPELETLGAETRMQVDAGTAIRMAPRVARRLRRTSNTTEGAPCPLSPRS
jgi:predicted TIM-barrel fold metal-dependent hydrolase